MPFPNKLPKKSAITFLIVFAMVAIYFMLTGSLPSFNPEKRYRDFSRVYFHRNSDVYVKEVDMSGTGFKSFIVFEKASYFKKIFVSPKSLDHVEKHVDDAFKARKLNEGKKLIIFKPLDFGILSPAIQFFLPLKKVFEVELLNNNDNPYQIYNVDNIDIDGDGKQELIVHWLAYGGGSGGTFISAVISENEDQFKIADFFPVPQPITIQDVRAREEYLADKSNFENEEKFNSSKKSLINLKKIISKNMTDFKKDGYLLYIDNEEYYFNVNGKKTKFSLSSYHTDNYFNFMQVGNSKGFRLISAQSFGDTFGHYAPQSWSLTSFRFVGKKFVPDFEFQPAKIDKKTGWSITEVHGYTTSPNPMGLISYMLLPPWLEMQDRDDAIMKSKVESVVIGYFNKKFQKKRHNIRVQPIGQKRPLADPDVRGDQYEYYSFSC